MARLSAALLRLLGPLAAGVFLAGLVTVAVHRDPRGLAGQPTVAGLAARADGSSATTTASSLGTGGRSSSAGPGTTGAPRTQATVTTAPDPAAPITPAPGQASLPGPVEPTAAGGYVYAETIQGRDGDRSATVHEAVAGEPSPSGEVRQSVTDNGSDASSGQSASSHREVTWRSTGLYLRSEDFTFGGNTYTCTFASPVQELALPLAVGKRWALEGTCALTVFGQPITLKLSGTAHVSGFARAQVGAQAVNVWVVDSTFDVTGSGAYSFTLHQTSSHDLAPAQGLDVAETSTNTTTSPRGSDTFTESRRLQSLQPA